ncbi:MAG TPA: UDP-N-acetylmuramate--L-alanine ligase [Firmicutes bacterium]|nr:UDP-N-acetylmuramate--L-alanine ligase [Bacillota bacterium]
MTSQRESVHFIAIGGIGMSALAKILLSMGYRVSGSDEKESDRLQELRSLGATIYIGHAAEHVPADCKEVIYSSAINMEENPEYLCAVARNIPITHRGSLLARLVNAGQGFAVAGAHGKTTTSGMLSLILYETGKNPNIVIGGTLPQIKSNAQKGDSDIWAIEADESDGSFLELHPYLTVVTNIEEEHMEHYKTRSNLDHAFAEFCDKSQHVILCLDSKMVRETAQMLEKPYATYGLEHLAVDLTARNLRYSGRGSDAEVYYRGEKVADLHLNIPGRHNIVNALGAMYAAFLAGIDFSASAEVLEHFTGMGRRFEVIYEDDNIMVVDDYAHHPTEVKATIEAGRNCCPKRLVAVFQPHRYSRVLDHYVEFGNSFGDADIIIISEIYSAWEEPIQGVTSQKIVDELEKKGLHPIYMKSNDVLLEYLKSNVEKGDLVLMMGAGDIWKTTKKFGSYLKGEKS